MQSPNPQTSAAPRTQRAPRPLRPALFPLATTSVLAVVSGVFYALDLQADGDLASLLYLSAIVAALNAVHAFAAQGRRAGIGLLVLHGAMLFWFYYSGIQTWLEEETFARRFTAIHADEGHFLQALVMVNAFYFTAMLGYLVRPPGIVQRGAAAAFGRDVRIGRRQLLWLILGLFVVGFGFYMVAAGGPGGVLQAALGSRAHKSAWDSQGNYGTGLSSLHFLFQACLVVCANLALYAALVRRDVGWRWLTGAIFVVTTLYIALESGTRNTLLQCVMPAALVYLRHVRREPAARQILHYAVMAVLGLGLMAGSVYQHRARNATVGAVEVEELEMKVDSDFLSETAGAVAVQEVRKGALVYEMPGLLVLAGPVPRVLWSSKPAPEVYVVYSKYRFGIDVEERGGNALPSVVGQYYIGWGWFGVLEIGLLLGLWMGLFDRVMARHPRHDIILMSAALAMSYLFVVFRYISFGFFPPVMVMLMLVQLLRRKRRAVRPVPRPMLDVPRQATAPPRPSESQRPCASPRFEPAKTSTTS